MYFNPKNIQFSFYNQSELEKIMEVLIDKSTTFDTFGHPLPGGIHDPRLGPLPGESHCKKCNLSFIECPGHFGKIELNECIINPLSIDIIVQIINGVCINCCQLLLQEKIYNFKKNNSDEEILNNFSIENNEILNRNNLNFQDININKEELIELLKLGKDIIKCKRCFKSNYKYVKGKGMRILCNNSNTLIYMQPSKILNLIEFIYKKNEIIRNILFKDIKPDSYFIKYIPVMPNKFRPFNLNDGLIFEDPQNNHLINIIKINNLIRSVKKEKIGDNDEINVKDWKEIKKTFGNINENKNEEKKTKKENNEVINLNDAIDFLQSAVMVYYDSESGGRNNSYGHKQILEKKEGLFRKHIMGKRVNYSARSVISPDPNLSTREIGIPVIFAEKLTFPEVVNELNHDRLKRAVLNGEKYPGALFVEENGILKNIKFLTEYHKRKIANQLRLGRKIVHRHLQNGDIVLLNRQPTLHKPSIMGHIVKILPGEKTIRLHYTNCNSYNADFDGDEMNIHFMQDQISRSEGYNLCNTDKNFLVSTNGSPIRGLVQDHIIIAARTTLKDNFITEDEYKYYITPAIDNNDHPFIGNKFYKNKRIILQKPAIRRPKRFYTGKQIISTILLNLNLPISFSKKNKIPENLLGGHEENIVIFKNGIHMTGILDKSMLGATSHSLIHACGEAFGYDICNDLLTSISRVFNRIIYNEGFTLGLDDLYLDEESEKNRINIQNYGLEKGKEIIENIYNEGLDNDSMIKEKNKRLKKNNDLKENNFIFDRKLNKIQRKNLIKKIISEKNEIDLIIKKEMNLITTDNLSNLLTGQVKKFPYNNMGLIILSGSKGSMVNFGQITCLLGQQELEGKRVPILISGRSLPCYDLMNLDVRSGGYIFNRFLSGMNLTDFYFHCMAGREGLIDTAVKTSVSGYLQRCLIKHLEGVKVEYDGTVRVNNQIIQFLYSEDNLDTIKCTFDDNIEFIKENILRKYSLENLKNESEKIKNYLNKNEKIAIEEKSDYKLTDKDILEFIISQKKSVEPGEPVGILAAQAIGEPSTQMTLNTFHLAGVGSKNVTLGMPRLRELLMVATKIPSTPMITVSVNENIEKSKLDAILDTFTSTKFKDMISSYKIIESYQSDKKIIKIEFKFIKSGNFYIHLKKIKKKIYTEIIKIKQQGRSFVIKKPEEINIKNQENQNEESHNNHEENSSYEIKDDSDNNTVENKLENENITDNENKFENENIADNQISDSKYKSNLTNEDENFLLELTDDYKISHLENDNIIEIEIDPSITVDTLLLLNQIIEEFNMDISDGIKKIYKDKNNLIIEADSYTSIFNSKPLTYYNDNTNENNVFYLNEVIDFYNSYSNNVYDCLNILGIEAARTTIIKEIKSVFDVYGISINIRHLMLIADYMCAWGNYKPFNRYGLNNSDPLHKMSFESCYKKIKESVLNNDIDELNNPSSRITLGLPIYSGTGNFKLFFDYEKTI